MGFVLFFYGYIFLTAGHDHASHSYKENHHDESTHDNEHSYDR